MSAGCSGQGSSIAHRLAHRAALAAERRQARDACNAAVARHALQSALRFEPREGTSCPTVPVTVSAPPLAVAPPPCAGSPAAPTGLRVTSPLNAFGAGIVVIAVMALLLTPALRPRWASIALAHREAVALAPLPEVTARVIGPLGKLNEAALASVQAIDADPESLSPIDNRGAAASAAKLEPEPAPSLNSAAVASISQEETAAATRAPRVLPARPQASAIRAVPPEGGAPVLSATEVLENTRAARMARCEAGEAPSSLEAGQAPASPADFGKALAAAALRQTFDFTVYTDKYRTLAFPMGDVPPLYGVCTDVVIRAYRALGVDLQARVHSARIGSGDTSIAHRRTFTLRRYFASRGASLPITDFAEDYLPGDVVSYHRPQNSGSRDHIAIVADAMGPSGRPMIIHNRGWGAQMEDALFVDRITGHYRYTRVQDQLAVAMALKTILKVAQAGSAGQNDAAHSRRRVKALRSILKARAGGAKAAVKQ